MLTAPLAALLGLAFIAATSYPRRSAADDGGPDADEGRPGDSEERLHARALASLPRAGWQHLRSKRALLLAAEACGALEGAGRAADSVLDWLDRTFGGLRRTGATRAPILRVFPSTDAMIAHDGSADPSLAPLERTACLTPEVPGLFPRTVNMELLSFWMDEHCPDLMLDLPWELNVGLRNWVLMSDFDGRRVTPPPLDIFLDSVRASLARGETLDLRATLTDVAFPAPEEEDAAEEDAAEEDAAEEDAAEEDAAEEDAAEEGAAEGDAEEGDPAEGDAAEEADDGDPTIPGALGFLLVDHFLTPRPGATSEDRATFARFLEALRDGRSRATARSAGTYAPPTANGAPPPAMIPDGITDETTDELDLEESLQAESQRLADAAFEATFGAMAPGAWEGLETRLLGGHRLR